MQQNAKKFVCDVCDFICSKQSNFNNHLITAKHKNRTEPVPENANNFDCECGRKYNARNSLWYHKQKCTYTPTPPLENTIVYGTEQKPQPTTDQCSAELIVLVKELMLQLTAKDKQLTELPCPFLKSDPISFSEYVKKPLQSIMQQNTIFHENICDCKIFSFFETIV